MDKHYTTDFYLDRDQYKTDEDIYNYLESDEFVKQVAFSFGLKLLRDNIIKRQVYKDQLISTGQGVRLVHRVNYDLKIREIK